MAPTRVDLNSSGVRELLRDPAVEAHLEGIMQGVLAQAKSLAPVVSGAYRDSIDISTSVTDRVVVRVFAAVPYAMRVEAKYGTLGKALDGAMGLVRYTTKDGRVRTATAKQAANWSRNRK